jgi:GDP-mannose 6-dehydrogenase
MHVSIFGAGYVGCVTAACLAAFGHKVWLVEIDSEKRALLEQGKSPVFEPGLEVELGRGLQSGRVIPVASGAEAVEQTELALVCVGTPSTLDGSSDMAQVRGVLEEIATAAAGWSKPYVIALRSTVPYPQVRAELLPVLTERLQDRFGAEVTFAINPEFLREGQALEDFRHPPFVVVGTEHASAVEKLQALYRPLRAPFLVVSPGTASLLKYACNAFHAVKIAFANEIASLEAVFGADANQVMETFCLDLSLNLSSAYLRPGYAFGGACLPKDLRALNRIASVAGVSCPLLGSVLWSNEIIVQRAVDAVGRLGVREVTLVGLSFKPGTDDLRESPLLELAERLLGKGYRLRIYDPDVQPESLRGQNLRYVEQRLEHLAFLLSASPAEALRGTPLVIVGKKLLSREQLLALCQPRTWIFDLIRQFPPALPPFRILRLGTGEAVGE